MGIYMSINLAFFCGIFIFICALYSLGTKKYHSKEPLENTLRLWLAVAILIAFPVFAFVLSLVNIGGGIRPYYIGIHASLASGKTGLNVISFLETIFLHSAALLGVFIFLFCRLSTAFFLQWTHYREVSNGHFAEDTAIHKIKDSFLQVMRRARLLSDFRIFVLNSEEEQSIPGFSGCGIVGGDNKIGLLLSEKFIDSFRKGKVSEPELESIFLHEISHIIHKDHFLPLYVKQFVRFPVLMWCSVGFSLAFLFSCIRLLLQGNPVGLTLWRNLLYPVILVFLGFFVMRIVILNILAHTMREREYLADARAYTFDGTSENIIKAISKAPFWASLRSPFSSSFNFAQLSKMEEAPFASAQRLVHYRSDKIMWSPPLKLRIQYIKEKKFSPERTEGTVGSLEAVIVTAILVTLFWSFSIGLEKIFLPRGRFGEIGMVGIGTLPMMSAFLIVFYCFPLRFLDLQTLCNRYVGPYSPDPKHVYSLIFRIPAKIFSKDWEKIHINNSFIFSYCTFWSVVLQSWLEGKWPTSTWLIHLFMNFFICLAIPLMIILGMLTYKEKAYFRR